MRTRSVSRRVRSSCIPPGFTDLIGSAIVMFGVNSNKKVGPSPLPPCTEYHFCSGSRKWAHTHAGPRLSRAASVASIASLASRHLLRHSVYRVFREKRNGRDDAKDASRYEPSDRWKRSYSNVVMSPGLPDPTTASSTRTTGRISTVVPVRNISSAPRSSSRPMGRS